jgi:hypothetical protein
MQMLALLLLLQQQLLHLQHLLPEVFPDHQLLLWLVLNPDHRLAEQRYLAPRQ